MTRIVTRFFNRYIFVNQTRNWRQKVYINMAENDSKKPQVNKSGERWVPQYSGFSKVGHFFSFDQPGTPIFNKTQSQNKTSESQLTKEQQALKKAYQQESIESAQKQFLFLTEGERNQLLDWSDPF